MVSSSRNCVAGAVVDELEDHTFTATGEHILGGVELPAGIRRGIDETPPRRSGLLLRLKPGDAGLEEDPGE